MLRNYFRTAVRRSIRGKLFSVINVTGLAVGLACFIVIVLYVRHELSFDAQWANAERIYRVSRDYFPRDGARARLPASANAPIAPALVDEFPEIERAARIFGGRSEAAGRAFGQHWLLSREDVGFFEDGFRFADPALFAIFDFEWLQGDPATALQEPNAIVLTQALATKYFPDEDPVGQSLLFNNQLPLAVTGVIRDLPDNTHLSIDALASLSTLTRIFGPQFLESWDETTGFHTYVLLREGAHVRTVLDRAAAFLDRHTGDASSFSSLTFMNIADIRLRSNRDEEWKVTGRVATVYGFAVIAVGILLIACINFVNLATARASSRAREVAVRKSMGATKAQVVGQFIGEALLFSTIATGLAIALAELALPVFRAFTGTELPFSYVAEPSVLAALAGLTVIVGLMAGSYPAFYLSAFSPASVLKGEVTRGRSGARIRNALVVFQFAIAIVLLIGTAVVHQQTSFARNIDLGFSKEQIVVLTMQGWTNPGSRWPVFKEQLLSHPGILHVTASHYTPFSFDDNQLLIREPGSSSFSRIQHMRVDHGFFETYEIDVLAGRTFSPRLQSDVLSPPGPEDQGGQGGFVINESAARLFGWTPREAVGQRLDIDFDDAFTARAPGAVVGVVEDTYFESVAVAVRPMVFLLTPPDDMGFSLTHASIRVSPVDLPQALAHIDATWHAFRPEVPVTRRFLDQDFAALYRAEERLGRMFSAFTLLSIFVASLGLLGLAWYTTEQRTKEIGLRKVMGGTVLDIVRLLTAEVARLMVLANVIAWPVAYLLMQRWLYGFAYRVGLSLIVFAGSASLALAAALLTVGTIAARAAATNPIHSLRYE